MSKKIFLEEGPLRMSLRKQDLHAEHPTDVRAVPEKTNEVGPRNPNTHVSIRLPMYTCDWLWELYPNEPTISAAVQQFIKDCYVSGTRPRPVR